MDDGNTADVVYLDFGKAFDSVNPRYLLAKLESFGLCDKVARWITSYVTGKNLQSTSDRYVVARDKDQALGTSGATSILILCQRPPKCRQGDNTAFRQ